MPWSGDDKRSGTPHFGRELLAELRHFGGDHKRAVRLRRVVAEVLLVIILGRVERSGGPQFGDDRARPDLLGVELADGLLGGLALAVVMVEDDGAVLLTGVVALTVARGGVVDGEKDLQDLAVGRRI